MKRSLPMTLAAGTLVCLLLSACGGSSTATPSPTPSPTATLSASVLAGLVLPVQTLTVGGVDLNLDSADTGPQTRSHVLDGSFDTQRDSAELDRFGWRADLQQTFAIPSAKPASGVFLQITTIDLLDTSEHATQALATRLADVLSDVGKTSVAQSGDSATLAAAAAFTPVGFDGATGETWSLNQSGTLVYLTIVSFSRGPLLVSVGVGSHDQSDQKTAVVALAHQVETQIGTVVAP